MDERLEEVPGLKLNCTEEEINVLFEINPNTPQPEPLLEKRTYKKRIELLEQDELSNSFMVTTNLVDGMTVDSSEVVCSVKRMKI